MTEKKPVIGVLALQGAVELHIAHIEACGAKFLGVKTKEEFNSVDAFILPGGESTTMLKLIENFDLWQPLVENFKTKPVWGICAGCILIASKVTHPIQKSFDLLPITVQRNAYGRQLDSHYSKIFDYEVSFIRAPIITHTEKNVEILAENDGSPVWVKQNRIMASTFHPELTRKFPSPMHKMFIEMI